MALTGALLFRFKIISFQQPLKANRSGKPKLNDREAFGMEKPSHLLAKKYPIKIRN
jgi:hypothetical protein